MATLMKCIEPLAITDGMVGSAAGTVVEVEHPEWAGGTTYNALQRVIVKGTQGTFVDLGAGGHPYIGLAAAPNGDVYSCALGGSIWIQAGGVGSFVDLVTGNKNWNSMCAAPNGDIYACVYGGSIWKRTSGSGSFVDISAGTKNWTGVAIDPDNNVYACVNMGSVWKQPMATGSFVDLGVPTNYWMDISISSDGLGKGVYLCQYNGGLGGISISTLEVIHKIYESQVAGNISRYPPIDVRQTTPQWLEISSTNKWKALDHKTTSQTVQASPIVYTITPGVAINSVVLLNVAATSVRIQATTGSYSNTIATGATDYIDMVLPGGVGDVITITITNSGGLAEIGEIILGNYYTLGTFRPGPTVGIMDYSTKTADVFGDYTIVPRAFSKKMTCALQIAVASVDAVFNKLAGYRSTPMVWVGSSSYSTLIIYGFYKDFSIVFSSPKICDCSLEIEGLT